MRINDTGTKYDAVTGTKKSRLTDPNEEPAWRWMEKEMVDVLEKWDYIDRRYFDSLVDDAVAAIQKFGDYEMFADPAAFMNEPEELPFD